MTQLAKTQSERRAKPLTCGIAIGTGVVTLEGEMPVEFLSVGDRILTRSGMRVLRDISVSVLKDVDVVVITESSLGVDRPTTNVVVLPHQGILIRDWRAKALYGTAQAVIPAARLVDGEFIRSERREDLRLYSLAFDDDVVIYAGDLELSCVAAPVQAAA